MPGALEDDFLRFIAIAKSNLPSKQTRSSLLASFQGFLDRARPLMIADIKCRLDPLAERAARASSWIVRHDLLAIAGFAFVENAYTELMRWALDPATHPESALDRQRAWLVAIGIEPSFCESGPCRPQTQMRTDDGIPDLILQFRDKVAIVEVKTGTVEHPTPSGALQTVAYPIAVRNKLGLPPEAQVEIVFITTDRSAAENPHARNTTFLDFVLALAGVLSASDLPAETRSAFSLLFTHLLNYAVESTSEQPPTALIERVVHWSHQPTWRNDDQILAHRDDLLAAIELLLPGK